MKFKLNSKGMKDEGYKLEIGHKKFLYKILVVNENWLYDNGYKDGEYIRLSHIMSDERYFDFDKRMLNELRDRYLSNPIMNLPF